MAGRHRPIVTVEDDVGEAQPVDAILGVVHVSSVGSIPACVAPRSAVSGQRSAVSGQPKRAAASRSARDRRPSR